MTHSIAIHLWQSTVFVGVAALLVLLTRSNHAKTRYYIWLAASLKFLVPFSALVAIGGLFAWRTDDPLPGSTLAAVNALTTFVAPDLSPVAAAVSTVAPAAPSLGYATLFVGIWFAGAMLLTGVWAMRWRRIHAALQSAARMTEGREIDILRRVERASGLSQIPLLVSKGSLEPGIVGFLRPVILWPTDISQRMSDAQIEAILLHELTHARRRDNLCALLHMAVQAVFWFHPLVWWIGARLVDERERACDEEVVLLGTDPHQYAESILRTCEYAVASPLPCVAGVTGSDLKRRIVTIVSHRPMLRLGAAKVALLTAIGLVATVGPLAAGALSSPSAVSINRDGFVAVPTAARATSQSVLKFEVASIKLNRSTGPSAMAIAPAGRPLSRFNHGGSIRALLQRAYGLPYVQQIGGPEWIREDTYIITATIPEGVESTPDNINAMIRALLVDRFKFTAREETRDLPVYDLMHARSDKTLGPNLTPVAPECLLPNNTCGQRLSSARGSIEVRNSILSRFASMLEFSVGRPIIDRTGLTDRYDLMLKYAEDGQVAAGASELPSLFTALQEQLGLKLESTRGPVKVLVIDSIQRPTED